MSWWNDKDAQILAALARIEGKIDTQTQTQRSIMAGLSDVQSAQTTLHQDLVSETGLIKQILAAVANGNLTPTAAQALVDAMNADDADAKSNIAAITAALPPAPAPTPGP